MSSTSKVAATKRRGVPINIGITGLWRHRQTLRVLVQRDLAVKYQKTVMGYFWSLLEPMGMAAIYWFIFGVVYGGSTRAGVPHDVSYGLYVVTGIFAWMWASSAMSESTSSLTSQTSLITTMRVPREVFPVARVFARFAEFLAGIPIIVVFAIFGGGTFGWHLVFLPLAVIIQATLLTGISFILASLNVLYRDVQRFMRLATRILFYSIPTIYPLYRVLHAQSMPNWVKAVYQINPYVGIMQLHHEAWIPGLNLLNWKMVVTSAAISVVVLFLGRWVFYRLEPSVLKEL